MPGDEDAPGGIPLPCHSGCVPRPTLYTGAQMDGPVTPPARGPRGNTRLNPPAVIRHLLEDSSR